MMGKHKQYDITKYVSYDADTDISRCLECDKIMRGLVTGNIKRHYAKIHSKRLDRLDKTNLNEQSTSRIQTKIQKPRETNHISIKMNRNEFVMCCVGLVTVKNIPLRIFDDEQFFKKLILPFEEKFNTNVDSNNIVENVNIVSNKMAQIISTSVRNKITCLKLDMASQMTESILGINIQYIKDFEIFVITIGVIQLKRNYTAQFLKDEILNCIKKFNINMEQLYSIITDNGTYMLKTSKLLQELQEDTETHSNMQNDNIENVENPDEYEEIHRRLTSVLTVVRCAPLSIQLAAQDVLKTIQSKVEECRNAIKIVRVIAIVGEDNITMPVTDNSSSWISTFEMINSLSKLRGFINNSDHKLKVPDIDWNFVAEFIEAFQPLSECSKKFQCEQYIVGDFYRDWLCCEIELEELIDKNTYAPRLSEALKRRKESLLTDDTFISAIYLDPRFNFLNSPFFTEDERRVAVNHLLKLYNTIKCMTGELHVKKEDLVNTSDHHHNSPSSGKFSKLENKVDSRIGTMASTSTEKNMKQTLENLSYAERVPFETNILEYWKRVHHRDSELGNLIQVALSVPCTQASVEGAVSALSVILTSNRTKLSQETIENLLLVKLNSHLLTQISLED